MIFDQWRRTRLANLITARAEDSADTAINPKRASMLVDNLSLKQLQRVKAFTKRNPDHYPELPEKIIDVAAPQRDSYLDHLELLSRRVSEMETLYSPLDNASDIPFTTGEIIGHVLTFLQQESTPELTDQQKGALVAVYFLLTKYWTPDSYPDEFPKLPQHSKGQLTSGEWLTKNTLNNPDRDPDSIYHTHKHRITELKRLTKMFSQPGTPNVPVPAIFIDYPGKLLNTLHLVSRADYNDYIPFRDLAYEGTPALHMEEALGFAQAVGTSLFTWMLYPDWVRVGAALHNYEAFRSHPNLLEADSEMLEQCKAMVKVGSATALYASTFMTSDCIIADERLVNLLMEHPERADELAYLIKQRGTADFDLLVGITSNVLGEGLL